MNFLEKEKYPKNPAEYGAIKTFNEHIMKESKKSRNPFKKIFRREVHNDKWLKESYSVSKIDHLFVPIKFDEDDSNLHFLTYLDDAWVDYQYHIQFGFFKYVNKKSEHFGFPLSIIMKVNRKECMLKYNIFPRFNTELIPSPANYNEMFLAQDMSQTDFVDFLNFKEMKNKRAENKKLLDLTSTSDDHEIFIIWFTMWCL